MSRSHLLRTSVCPTIERRIKVSIVIWSHLDWIALFFTRFGLSEMRETEAETETKTEIQRKQERELEREEKERERRPH